MCSKRQNSAGILDGNLLGKEVPATNDEIAVDSARKRASCLGVLSQAHVGIGEKAVSRSKSRAV